MAARITTPTEGYQQLESMLVKQLLDASGAFKGSGAAGADLRMGLFVEALSDAVSKSGGFGLAAMLERQMGEGEAPAKGSWDDPNSDVALPDGYAAPDGAAEAILNDQHLHGGRGLSLTERKGEVSPNIVSRALIKYRERADDKDGVKSD